MSFLRVMVLDAWDDFKIPFVPDAVIGEIKQQVLQQARVTNPSTDFMVKFRGAEVQDETVTLAQAGVPESGSLIVMRRRRQPVR